MQATVVQPIISDEPQSADKHMLQNTTVNPDSDKVRVSEQVFWHQFFSLTPYLKYSKGHSLPQKYGAAKVLKPQIQRYRKALLQYYSYGIKGVVVESITPYF